MDEKADNNELKAEIERGHYARAARVAASRGLPEEEIHELRCKALCQISAIYRNTPGTKILAQEYEFSKKEAKQILERYAEEKRKGGEEKTLEPCYDHGTGKYLSFEEWMHHFFKNWDKL